jgi:hypothetical protein
LVLPGRTQFAETLSLQFAMFQNNTKSRFMAAGIVCFNRLWELENGISWFKNSSEMHFSFVRYPYLCVSCVSLLLQGTVTMCRLDNIQRIKIHFRFMVPCIIITVCMNVQLDVTIYRFILETQQLYMFRACILCSALIFAASYTRCDPKVFRRILCFFSRRRRCNSSRVCSWRVESKCRILRGCFWIG